MERVVLNLDFKEKLAILALGDQAIARTFFEL